MVISLLDNLDFVRFIKSAYHTGMNVRTCIILMDISHRFQPFALRMIYVVVISFELLFDVLFVLLFSNSMMN